jgi:hypothetical protein
MLHGSRWVAVCGLLLAMSSAAFAHDGPDPVSHWYFAKNTLQDGKVKARLGLDAKIHGAPKLVDDNYGSALRFDGAQDFLVIGEGSRDVRDYLPSKILTVSAWVAVEAPQPHGGIVGQSEEDGEGERGWRLGYNDHAFTFALSTFGSNDGNGKITKLVGQTDYEVGKYYHVVATYDGARMRLYVNGKLDGESDGQSGEIYYARTAPYIIGAVADRDEQHFHQGLIRDVAVYDLVATEKWVEHEFEHGSELVALAPVEAPDELRFVVPPYLQYVTQDGITVMWETTRPAKGKVQFGETDEFTKTVDGASETKLHEIRLEGLKPEMGYFYKVSATDDQGRTIESQVSSFQSANLETTPFAFGVIADTQGNPGVCKTLTDMMWMQRPNFFIIPGDLVDSGPNKKHWTEHFFPGLDPIASRVAFFPIIGNHEQNAKFYYDYVSCPAPEYYYTFKYGNAQFFMIDSNKECGPDSEQYKWLEAQLAESHATWKFVSYHHPSYSSDEDDYGDMWKGKSEHGDLRLRPLSNLYDRYGVDIVWNGHIHSYERTWPLVADKPVEHKGTIYMVTGGGGGNLETAGPIKPYFQNNVKHGHHYCLVGINGRTLEFKAFDLEGRLFDYMKIDKSMPEIEIDTKATAGK